MSCETHQLALSCLLDHELPAEETADTVDHLLSCDDCRGFYRRARALDIELLAASGPATPVPTPRFTPRRWWPVAAAAVLAAAVGLAWFNLEPTTPTPVPDNVIDSVGSLEMSDDRFVDITVELLQANPRYHLEMLDVLHQAHRQRDREEGPWLSSLARADFRDGDDNPADNESLVY